MAIKDFDELDLKLILQKGNAISVDGIEVEPHTIGEIVEFGYSKYMHNIQWVSLSIDDFMKSIAEADKREVLESQRDKLKTLDFYIQLGGQEMMQGLIESLSMILKTDDVRILEDGIIAVGFKEMGIFTVDDNGEYSVNGEILESINEEDLKIIHRDNFDEIIQAVKLQNFIKKPSEVKEDTYEDEATRKLAELMKKNAERVNNIKKNQSDSDEDGIDISDIISAVSSKSYSINELNVWELTLYQLYQKYSRLELIDNYDFSIKAMMAGAEKIDLKHWSSKL